MIDIAQLYALRQRVIIEIHQEISTTVPIDDRSEDKILTEIPLVLFFDSYRLLYIIIGIFQAISQMLRN